MNHRQTLSARFLHSFVLSISVILMSFLSGCATSRHLITDPWPSSAAGDSNQLPAIFDPNPIAILQGQASTYGKPQNTASGERFNPRALTAAHKSLPLHSVVRVTNRKNNRSVVVRINDRGPYVRGRIIDLSTAAAEKIDMLGAGVVPVQVEIFRRIDVMSKPNLQIPSQQAKRPVPIIASEPDIPPPDHPHRKSLSSSSKKHLKSSTGKKSSHSSQTQKSSKKKHKKSTSSEIRWRTSVLTS